MPPTLRLGGAYVSAAYRHLGVTRFEHHPDPGRVRRGGCERGLILGFGLWRGLMLDRLPVLGQPAPPALDQRNRIRSEFRRRHLTEPVGGMAVAAGPAIEGFSNVRVRLDFPARNGLTKFGVAELPGIERFAADAEKVSELLVGQSEQAHPIRAVGKLRSISTRTPNAARRAVRLAPAGLFRTGFRLGDVHQRTGNKRGFPCAL